MRHSKSTADSNDKRRKATCHCGAVELELSLPDGIVNPRHCDCSSCRRKGAIVTSVPLSGIRIVKGRDALEYRGPGYFGRTSMARRDERFAYNHIVEVAMMLWLAKAAGVA